MFSSQLESLESLWLERRNMQRILNEDHDGPIQSGSIVVQVDESHSLDLMHTKDDAISINEV